MFTQRQWARFFGEAAKLGFSRDAIYDALGIVSLKEVIRCHQDFDRVLRRLELLQDKNEEAWIRELAEAFARA